MSAPSAGRRPGSEPGDGNQVQRPKGKLGRPSGEPTSDGKHGPVKRIRDIELYCPVVYGNVSFQLGAKGSHKDAESTHKWVVYIRSTTNQDLSPLVKKVVFQLHPSFNNPTRVVDKPPFELTESGWGEFEMTITLFFHLDIAEKQVELQHHLKLYPEDESAPPSKKPTVVETYDELVFPEPTEGFFERIKLNPALRMVTGPHCLPSHVELAAEWKKVLADAERATEAAPQATEEGQPAALSPAANIGTTFGQPLQQYFLTHAETEELQQLQAARVELSQRMSKLEKEYAQYEKEIAEIKQAHTHKLLAKTEGSDVQA